LGNAFEKAEQQQDSLQAIRQNRTKKVLGERLRRSRTAARFAPLPCEAATTKTQDSCPSSAKPQRKKTLETLPTERIRKNEPPGKTQPKRCLGSAFEKAEQQQDSPQATQQNQTKKVLEERLRTSRAAARFAPMHCETATKKTLETLPTERIRKKEPPGKTQPKKCLGSAFEKAEQQQDSLQAIRQKVLGERLRKSRTAARFAPLPCEAATTKTLETLPTESFG